jgi:hypothetical protein
MRHENTQATPTREREHHTEEEEEGGGEGGGSQLQSIPWFKL